MSPETRRGRLVQNHVVGARKKAVYCYDYHTKEFLFMFEGARIMERALESGSAGVRRKLDKNSLLRCVYNGKTYNLLIYSHKL